MTPLRSIGLLSLAGWAILSPGLAAGVERHTATSLYSRGVHAYFAGRASEAESLFSSALGLDDEDPRFRYFRALSRLRLGRQSEARTDMAVGAALEAARPNRYAVGTALQRVQGSDRLVLERYRREARSQAVTVGAEIARQRAEQMSARDAGAVREKVVIPLEELLRPGDPQALSAEEAARRAEMVRPAAAAPAVPGEVAPPATEAAAEDNPFLDDTGPAREPAAPRSEPTATPVAAPAADDAEDNPFDF